MATFGMDSTGFNKKTLSDIKASLEENLTAVFGPINTDPESIFGQLIGTISEDDALLWDLAEDTYFGMYPTGAEGIQLDNVADLTGITRLGASSSFVTEIFEGDELTIIPVETQVKQQDTNEIFETDSPITITKDNVLRIVLTVNTVTDSITYSSTIDAVVNSIDSGIGATEESILLALKTEIDTNMLDHTTSINNGNTELTVTITDKETPFTADKTTEIDMERWTPGTVLSVNKGTISIPAETIISIETPVSGLNQVNNLTIGEAGREVETDDEFRLRRKQSLRVAGAGTIPAIEARLFQEVDGVSSVVAVENRTDLIDIEGRPPHSFEVIISGGTDQDIIDKLWEIKPAGIQTFGSESGQILDSQGTLQTLYFSRPVPKYAHMEVEITLYSEEQFPSDGLNAIKQAIVDFGDAFQPGDDLITQRFYTPIYTIPGILDIPKLDFAITEEAGDSTSTVSSGTVTSLVTKKLLDSGATFITDGVVSGMVIKNTTDSLTSSVLRVISETELDIVADIFDDIGDGYSVGGFEQVNIPLASDELAKFASGRIVVSIV